MPAVGGKYAVEARQIAPGLEYQSGELGDEIERLENDVRGGIALKGLWLVEYLSSIISERLNVWIVSEEGVRPMANASTATNIAVTTVLATRSALTVHPDSRVQRRPQGAPGHKRLSPSARRKG